VTSDLTLCIPAKSDSERDAVAAAWRARGGDVVALDRFWDPPLLDRSAVRLYGNDTFCLVVAQKLGLTLISPPDDLLIRLGPAASQRAVAAQTLSQALLGPFPAFIKPLVPKVFRAAVYPGADALRAETVGLQFDTPILNSEIVSFEAEARAWVLNGEIKSCAIYEGDGRVDAAREFLQTIVVNPLIPTTCVLDAGFIPGRGWALIEANATWGAGLNDCDAAAAAECLEWATQ
jgi:hypothetical protein